MSTTKTSHADATPEVDASLLNKPLAGIKDGVEDLHGTLNNFAQGRTPLLKGDRTRDRISHALCNLDRHVAELDHICASQFPPLQGCVTAEMTETIEQTQEHLEHLHNLLEIALAAGRKNPRDFQELIQAWLAILEYDLDQLDELAN